MPLCAARRGEASCSLEGRLDVGPAANHQSSERDSRVHRFLESGEHTVTHVWGFGRARAKKEAPRAGACGDGARQVCGGRHGVREGRMSRRRGPLGQDTTSVDARESRKAVRRERSVRMQVQDSSRRVRTSRGVELTLNGPPVSAFGACNCTSFSLICTLCAYLRQHEQRIRHLSVEVG